MQVSLRNEKTWHIYQNYSCSPMITALEKCLKFAYVTLNQIREYNFYIEKVNIFKW